VACGRGVDVYFDNVGGPVARRACSGIHEMRFRASPLCGLISGYDNPGALAVKNFRSFLVNPSSCAGHLL